MLRSVKAQDYMCNDLITFTPETDLFDAINQLLSYKITGAPVVDSKGCFDVGSRLFEGYSHSYLS